MVVYKHKTLSGILYLNIKTHRVSTVCLLLLWYGVSRIFQGMMTTTAGYKIPVPRHQSTLKEEKQSHRTFYQGLFP